MFHRLKVLLTHEIANSFEPVVMLPAWKSVIVDWLTFFSCGRWRWSGITLEEWYNGFTTVRFTCDDSLKTGSVEMDLIDELMTSLDAKLNEPKSVSNKTLNALLSIDEKLKLGLPLSAKRVTVEHTPDGPLTTVEDITLGDCNECGNAGKGD